MTDKKPEKAEDEKNNAKNEAKETAAQAPESKKAEQPEQKKAPEKAKKEEAIARGVSLPLSKKHCMYICSFIKNKPVDQAIAELHEVMQLKRAIPFKGEIPHRKGMMSGRYPVNAAQSFITILKGLRGNILVNGIELEKARIYYASASWASRPYKRGGARFKRAHIILKAREAKEIKK